MLAYLFPEELPMRAARGVQAVNTVWALAKREKVLFFPAAFGKEAFAYYGLPERGPLICPVPRSIPGGKAHFVYLLRLLPRLKPVSVLYTRHIKTAWWLVKTRGLHRRRIIYEAHEIFAEKKKGLERKEAEVLRGADLVVCVSRGLSSAIKRLFAVKARVVPNGTRIIPLNVKAKFLRPVRDIYYVGTLRYPWKGGDTLLSSLPHWPEGLELTVIGEGRRHPRIRWRGFISPAKIPELLKEAQVGLLPNSAQNTQSRFYTCPLKLLDYLGAGCAVVASRLESVREIVSEEEALLVPPDNPKALAEAVALLSRETKLALKLAEAAYRRAKDFTWERRAEKILSLIKEAL